MPPSGPEALDVKSCVPDFSLLVTRYQNIHVSKGLLVLTAGKKLEKWEFLEILGAGRWPQHNGYPADGVGGG